MQSRRDADLAQSNAGTTVPDAARFYKFSEHCPRAKNRSCKQSEYLHIGVLRKCKTALIASPLRSLAIYCKPLVQLNFFITLILGITDKRP